MNQPGSHDQWLHDTKQGQLTEAEGLKLAIAHSAKSRKLVHDRHHSVSNLAIRDSLR